ncbi:MAG: dipeptidase [Pseudomonadales bacterium]|nr:dipeptidase [Pseudomonadales bacterium]
MNTLLTILHRTGFANGSFSNRIARTHANITFTHCRGGFIRLLATALIFITPASYGESISEQAQRLADDLIIADTHIDAPFRLTRDYQDLTQATPRGEFNFSQAQTGGLDAAFMSIYIPAKHQTEGGAKALANQLIDSVEAMVGRAPQSFAMGLSVQQVRDNHKNGLVSLAMGIENGAAIEGELSNLKHFYERGIRYITLTHGKANLISDSSYDEHRPWGGISPFGGKVITEMNNLGIMIDISHLSDEAAFQAVKLSNVPVIATHSSIRKFIPGFERNMDDALLKALAKKGGVIQINFGSGFIDNQSRNWQNKYRDLRKVYLAENNLDRFSPQAKQFAADYRKQNPFPYAPIERVVDHIDHVRDTVGIEHVGFGSDFDGVGDTLPTGLKTVAQYPALIEALLKRGYSETQIEQIASGNLLRVWQQAEDYSKAH